MDTTPLRGGVCRPKEHRPWPRHPTENGKVRKILTNGMMMTLLTTPTSMGDGRALWVKSDESVLFFGSGGTATNIHQWTPSGGISLVRNDFVEQGNIVGDERSGDPYVSDRGANRVYRLGTNGVLTAIAGSGTTSGGGAPERQGSPYASSSDSVLDTRCLVPGIPLVAYEALQPARPRLDLSNDP